MTDALIGFSAGFGLAWVVQALRWEYAKFVNTRLLAQALRDDPTSVMHAMQRLRDKT